MHVDKKRAYMLFSLRWHVPDSSKFNEGPRSCRHGIHKRGQVQLKKARHVTTYIHPELDKTKKHTPCEHNNVTYIHPELNKTEVIHGSFVSVCARSFGVI